MAAKTEEDTSNKYEIYTNNSDVLAVDMSDSNNPTVIQACWSVYHNAWGVSDCPGSYYCDYTKSYSAYMLERNLLGTGEFTSHIFGNHIVISNGHLFGRYTNSIEI